MSEPTNNSPVNTGPRRSGSIFDFMRRHTIIIMWICVLVMVGFGAWSQMMDFFQHRGMKNEAMGSFQIPGLPVTTVQSSDWQDAGIMLKGDGQVDNLARTMKVTASTEDEVVWAFMILRAAASAAGIRTSDEAFVAEVNEMRIKQDPSSKELTMDDYRRLSTEAGRKHTRERGAISNFRTMADHSKCDPDFEKLYDAFKSQFEEIKLKYVFFDTKDAPVVVDAAKPEDRAKLEKFLADTPNVKSQKMVHEQLGADVLYVRYADVDNEAFDADYAAKWQKWVDEFKLTVTDDYLQKRFDDLKPAYEAAIAKAQERAASRPSPESKPVGDKPSEFELMKTRLRQEVLVSKLAEKVFDEVTRADKPMDLKAAAEKYGFRLASIEKKDTEAIQQQPDFGSANAAFAIFSELRDPNGLKPGQFWHNKSDTFACKGAIEEPGRSVAIWKITAFSPSRDPNLDDAGVLKFVTEEYTKKERQDLAKKRADEFKKAVDDRVTADSKAQEKVLDEEMQKKVEDRLKKDGLSREKADDKPKILEIENEEKIARDKQMNEIRGALEGATFASVAKDMNLKLSDTGFIRKTGARDAQFSPNEDLSGEERAARMFRKNARLSAFAGLQKGRVSQVEAEPTWYCATVAMLEDRRDPKPEEMYTLSKAQISQLKQRVQPYQDPNAIWNYDNFKKPDWFSLNAPHVEKSIEQKRDADQKAQERKSKRDVANRKKRSEAEAKMAAEWLSHRPLQPGEDW